MKEVMMFLLPLILAILPILVIAVIYYPVRRTDNIITIGYPFFAKKYNLLSSTLNLQVERIKGIRGHAYAVVIYVYQSDDRTLIRKHMLPGHSFQKSAEKELKKAERIINL